jgi:nucleotide-binding universal stress UspA family protein
MIAPIVAGADGSEQSLAATAWAAVAAARRRVPLCIVHVVDTDSGPPAHAHLAGHDIAERFRHNLPHHARSVLAKAAHRAVMAAPAVDLRTVAVYGHAGQVLTAITARASLLAVGTRGPAGLPGLRVNSVTLHLAGRARCPVVFVRADSSPVSHEIVVGTDDSNDAPAALEFGFGEADDRHARLTALYISALPHIARLEGYSHWMLSVGPPNASAVASLAKQVDPWRQKYPDVQVTESTVHGQPGKVLSMFSGHADLVVVAGDRIRPGMAPGPGSVADALLHHAQCPVAVIPGIARTADEADRGVLLSA